MDLRSSTTSRSVRLARSPSRRRIRRRSTPQPAKPICATTLHSATAHGVPTMPAKPGSIRSRRDRGDRGDRRQSVDTQRVFVAALGDQYKPGADRGVYRTSDGGATWQKVLYTDPNTGASSIAIDPANPSVLVAGMWQGQRAPYHLTSGGSSDGLYMSSDGGDHWTRLAGNGLPSGVTGRIAVTFAPSDAERIYALIDRRTDHCGAPTMAARAGRWSMLHTPSIDAVLFHRARRRPEGQDRVYFPSVDLLETTDGGNKVHDVRRPAGFGDDHQVWIDPTNTARFAWPAMTALPSRSMRGRRRSGSRWRSRNRTIVDSRSHSVHDLLGRSRCGQRLRPEQQSQ